MKMLKQFAYICMLKLVKMEMKSKAADLCSNWSMGFALFCVCSFFIFFFAIGVYSWNE